MRGLFRYEQKDTIMHRLDPRVKLCWVFGMSVLSMLFGTPLLLLAAFLSTFPFWLMIGPSRAKVRALLFVFGTMVFGFMLTQSLFYYWGDPENPTFTIIPATFMVIGQITGGIYFYAEGALYGLIQSLRFMTTVSAASAFVATTHPSELLIGLVRFVKVPRTDRWIGVPNEIAFMVSSAVGFAPSMIEESMIIINAMRARGLELKGGIRTKVKALRHIFFPMVVGLLRKGRQIAIAADARAFRAIKNRTFVDELQMRRGDYVMLIYTAALVISGFILSSIGFGGTAPGLGT
ncbi:MAG TPA: energy-coupling factor transporter transmembrane protein EcfT [Methanosarcinales archaeon]|nr:energy-coupling factor transporter transmembrane protein EcfT [Methanosarcinales archaeon]